MRNEAGEIGYKIMAGGGLGTPIIGSVIREFLPREDLIAYLEAVLRVYNLHGRRDNKYKARIKILVKALTPEVFAQKVEAEFEHTREALKIQPEILKKLDEEFTPFDYQDWQMKISRIYSLSIQNSSNGSISTRMHIK